MSRSSTRSISLAVMVLLGITLTTCKQAKAVAAVVALLEDIARTSRIAGEARLAEEAAALAKAGKLTDAARLCDELAAAKRAARSVSGEKEASRIAEAAKVLQREGLQALLDRLSQDQVAIFKTFEKVSVRVRFSFAQMDVKDFVDAFALGARNPDNYLVEIGKVNKELLARWKATPISKRVFIAGSKQDATRIKKLSSELDSEGYTTFFYEFCVEPTGKLCSAEAVGAFFSTSGNAILCDTQAARASRYISHEVRAALHLEKDQQMMIMVTPADVIAAAQHGVKKVKIIAFAAVISEGVQRGVNATRAVSTATPLRARRHPMEPQMTFGQHALLSIIDSAVLGALVLLVGFGLHRFLERYKSDLEWRRVTSASRTRAYCELWALTRGIGGTGSRTLLTAAERQSISAALSEWYWAQGNGLFVSHAATALLMKGWDLLKDQGASDDQIRQHYSRVRTRLKEESGVYNEEEGQDRFPGENSLTAAS